MECYFAAQKDNIFKNVEVLIYVFDVQSQELDKVEAMKVNGTNVRWFSVRRICITINHVWNRSYNIQTMPKSFVLYIKWIWFPKINVTK